MHGAVGLAAVLREGDAGLYPCGVDGEGELGKVEEVEAFTYVELESEVVGSESVHVGVDEVGATGYGVGPLDGVAEVLVEG